MIEVGEYVRTKRGDINKVIGIREELRDGKRIYGHKAYYLDGRKGSLTEAFIIKHSKDIIDLIEAGDYIDGNLVVEHAHNKGELYVTVTYIGGKGVTTFEDYSCSLEKYTDIESIVTKEQFKSIEYRLEN